MLTASPTARPSALLRTVTRTSPGVARAATPSISWTRSRCGAPPRAASSRSAIQPLTVTTVSRDRTGAATQSVRTLAAHSPRPPRTPSPAPGTLPFAFVPATPPAPARRQAPQVPAPRVRLAGRNTRERRCRRRPAATGSPGRRRSRARRSRQAASGSRRHRSTTPATLPGGAKRHRGRCSPVAACLPVVVGSVAIRAPAQMLAEGGAAVRRSQPPAITLAKVSRRPTVRTNTGLPGAESGSRRK